MRSRTCWRSQESSPFLLRESLNAHEYESGVRPSAFVMPGSPPARLSILSSSTLPNLRPPRPTDAKPPEKIIPAEKRAAKKNKMSGKETSGSDGSTAASGNSIHNDEPCCVQIRFEEMLRSEARARASKVACAGGVQHTRELRDKTWRRSVSG